MKILSDICANTPKTITCLSRFLYKLQTSLTYIYNLFKYAVLNSSYFVELNGPGKLQIHAHVDVFLLKDQGAINTGKITRNKTD